MQRVYCFARNSGSASALDETATMPNRRTSVLVMRLTAKPQGHFDMDGVLDPDAEIARFGDGIPRQVDGKRCLDAMTGARRTHVDRPRDRVAHAVQPQQTGERAFPSGLFGSNPSR